MRAVRLVIAVLIVSPILMLAFSESRFSRQPFAQVTAAPGPVPLTAPVAPGQPQAFSTIGALPALAPAPGTSRSERRAPRRRRAHFDAPVRRREPGPSGPASSRRPAIFLRGQSASGQCASYLLNANAPSAYIAPEGSTAEPATADDLQWQAFTQRAQVALRWDNRILRNARRKRAENAMHAMRVQLNAGLIDKVLQIRRDRRTRLDVTDRRRVERHVA